ncbi:craniofacial development protein 2-like [Narcine bancroftii]|uniref:craniofacial development protein 2-like n=1 Tax=Narcine bancroftii TaxID=1343680 RepID=UPI003831E1DF
MGVKGGASTARTALHLKAPLRRPEDRSTSSPSTSSPSTSSPSTSSPSTSSPSKDAHKLKLACWNIRTMLDKADSHRPERRSALIAHELLRLDIDIAALSEVRLADVGSLQERGAGYTLYWSGKPSDERRLSGVGFMVKSFIASKLENLPTGLSDRIMSMRLPLQNKRHITLISVYAPTLQVEPAEKDKFYTDLRNLIQRTPTADKVVILGDFNARVGKDSETWPGILGKHGVGKCNDNGRLLLELCAEQRLVITNTLFQQRDSLKTTWMHPRSKHWHLLDYILVRESDKRDVLHTRVMPSAECHTDHRLVRCKLNLHFKPKPRNNKAPRKRFNVGNSPSTNLATGASVTAFRGSLPGLLTLEFSLHCINFFKFLLRDVQNLPL